jgi:folate-dependent phosphoribosylglycinamide formyltransferase PurN
MCAVAEKLRVALLTARPAGNPGRMFDYLTGVSAGRGWDIVGLVVDADRPEPGHRLRRLKAWRRQRGVPYAIWRVFWQATNHLRARRPRPSYARSALEIARGRGIETLQVQNVNEGRVAETLREWRVDLAVVTEIRILIESTYAAPSLGTLNVHHGQIPRYRGYPPAFWELHDGADRMGVSVHFVDRRLDHGPVIKQAFVDVREDDTPALLYARSLSIDYLLLVDALDALAGGHNVPLLLDWTETKVRTVPGPLAILRASWRRRRYIAPEGFRDAAIEPLPEPPFAVGSNADEVSQLDGRTR